MFENIIVGIIILHLIVGFGFIFYKLSGPIEASTDIDNGANNGAESERTKKDN